MSIESVLITGGCGYIGENLQQYLMNKGIYKIYDFDKLSGQGVEDLEIIPKVDFVVHLAAISGIPACQNNPSEAVRSNISASFNILKLAYRNNIPVILASSQAAKEPNSSFYASTKFIMEEEAKRLNELGMKNKILRFSNVYGGYQYLEKKTSVIANFCNAKLNNEQVKVHGDGSQERDFIHVNDLCEIIYGIMEKNDQIEEEIIDIGTGYMFSINEIIEWLELEYEYSNERSAGTSSNSADTDTLEKYQLDKANISNLFDYLNEFK